MQSVTEYKGALLHHVYRGPVVSVTCAVDKVGKLRYMGPFCVDHLTNSYAYDEEAHLVVYQKEEPRYMLRQAKSRDWHRVELHLSIKQMDDLARAWLTHRGFEIT